MPVELDQSITQTTTDLATHQQYGCSIEDHFYPEGAQVRLKNIPSVYQNIINFLYFHFSYLDSWKSKKTLRTLLLHQKYDFLCYARMHITC